MTEDNTPFAHRHGLPVDMWNGLTMGEKVQYMRSAGFEMFRTEYRVDEDWSWSYFITIECSCGATLALKTQSVCPDCGSEYKVKEGKPVKMYSPEWEATEERLKQ